MWLSLLQAHQQLSFSGSSQVSFSLIFCPAFDFFADSERNLGKYEILQYINLARVCLVIGHVFIMGKSIWTQYADIWSPWMSRICYGSYDRGGPQSPDPMTQLGKQNQLLKFWNRLKLNKKITSRSPKFIQFVLQQAQQISIAVNSSRAFIWHRTWLIRQQLSLFGKYSLW